MLSGLIGGIAIGFFTEYYTSASYKPTRRLASSGKTGPATVIIDGLSLGMLSTLIPVLIVGAVIFLSYFITAGFQWTNIEMGLFGVGIAAVGMLSTLGITLATDAYGPVADNAGGIAEMTHQPEFVRERTDALDSLGNTTAATGKGFAIGSAALTAITLLSAFAHTIKTLAAQLAPGYVYLRGKSAGSSRTNRAFCRRCSPVCILGGYHVRRRKGRRKSSA